MGRRCLNLACRSREAGGGGGCNPYLFLMYGIKVALV